MKKKFLIAFALVCMTLMYSNVALAVNHDFDAITLSVNGGWKEVPDSNTKSDGEQNAYVRITSKSTSSLAYARVRRVSDNVICTGEKAITGTGLFKIPYTKQVNAKSAMKLQFQTTTKTQTLKGTWCS